MEDNAFKLELNKLKRIFKDIPKDKLNLCDGLIRNAAFMKVSLDRLQETIAKEGQVVTSVNGNGFEVTQETAASKAYSTTINRYTVVIKQLTDLLPSGKEDTVSKAGEALAAFIAKGKG